MNRLTGRRNRAAIAAAAFVSFAPLCWGQTTSWKVATGSWSTGTNWTNGAPTSSSASVAIIDSGTAQIGSPGATANAVYMGTAVGSGGTVTLASGFFQSVYDAIGFLNAGTFIQSGGTHSFGSITLGDTVGSTGTYLLQGGSLPQGTLYVGFVGGAGTFTQSGGTVNSVITLGTLSGGGNYLLQAGTVDTSTLTIASATSQFLQTGGTLKANAITQTNGTVSLTDLTIGSSQNIGPYSMSGGTLIVPGLSVPDGGSFFMTGGTLSCATVTVSGGTATFTSALLDSGTVQLSVPTPAGVAEPVLNKTSGSLQATSEYLGFTAGTFNYTQPDGAVLVEPRNLYIGYDKNASATYTLNSGTLTGFANNETVGVSGAGTFIQNGGTNATGVLSVGGGSGTYLLKGGTLTGSSGFGLAESIGNSATGTFIQSGGVNNPLGNFTMGKFGTYQMQGGTLSAGVSTFNAGTQFVYSGGTVSFSSLTNRGKTSLTGAGDISISGSFSQASTGELDIALGGTGQGIDYASIAALGNATLNGSLVISLTNGFQPSFGSTFTILTAGSVQGAFSNITFPPGEYFNVAYSPTAVILTAIPEPAAVGMLLLPSLVLAARRFRKRRAERT
jgi:hypothetical protein